MQPGLAAGGGGDDAQALLRQRLAHGRQTQADPSLRDRL